MTVTRYIFLVLFLIGLGNANFFSRIARAENKPAARDFVISAADDEFLEDLSRRSFQFFWDHSNRKTGLTLDRARTNGAAHEPGTNHHNVASIAATGFALTALCVGAERKWVAPAEARERARLTLDFFANRAFHQNGWFYHWMDAETGERRWRSEVSSIDTALLLAGVLTARQCFADDREIERLARKIYERVDFQWMLAGDPHILSHGWRPESGFLKARWDFYSESSILYLLAIAAPTRPIPPAAWYAWRREFITYADYRYLFGAPPLFIHQYSQAWFDFRKKRERDGKFNVNYHENSVRATRAHREFCLSLSKEFPGYSANIWGISASDSVKGYVAWGGPPRDPAIDGTVVPYAAAGSLMFAPDISLPALKEMRERFGDKIYGRYGFAGAFNPNNGWVNPDVIGIDLGITLLAAENLRGGSVWRWFMKNRESRLALRRAQIR